MEILGLIFLVFGFVVYNTFAWGYVASVFYKWFVLPSFPTLPHFGYIEFIGFVLFIGILTRRENVHIKDEYKDSNGMWVSILLGPWLSLLLGWVIRGILF